MVLLCQLSVLPLTDCPVADDIAQLDLVIKGSELVCVWCVRVRARVREREKMEQELTTFQFQSKKTEREKKSIKKFFVTRVLQHTEKCMKLLLATHAKVIFQAVT